MSTLESTHDPVLPHYRVSRLPSQSAKIPGWSPATFPLAPEREPRAATGDPCRLLTCHEAPFSIQHDHIQDLWRLLSEGDVLVVNVSGSRDASAGIQTIFANTLDAAAVPWAGRALSANTILELIGRGVVVVPLTLDTCDARQPSIAAAGSERYRVPEPTAQIVNSARAAGRQVVAVGTTVLRALETMAVAEGCIAAGEGVTNLILSPGRRMWIATALLTGLHPPRTSHLAIVEAFVGFEAFARSYTAALDAGYRWGEWGDRQLLFRDHTTAAKAIEGIE